MKLRKLKKFMVTARSRHWGVKTTFPVFAHTAEAAKHRARADKKCLPSDKLTVEEPIRPRPEDWT